MTEYGTARRGTVTRSCAPPCADPIRVRAGERLFPDASRTTTIVGWTWCSDARGRAGWVPQEWMRREAGGWAITRDYDAVELSVEPGDELTVHGALAGFLWVTAADGRSGWVPEDHVRIVEARP